MIVMNGLLGKGASGGGVPGLTSANGGTAISDNAIIRGDGTTGIQGSVVSISDAGIMDGTTRITLGTYAAFGFADNHAILTYADGTNWGILEAGGYYVKAGATVNGYWVNEFLGLYNASFPELRFSRSVNAANAHNVGIGNARDRVLRITDGTSTGYGWTADYGHAALASDYTNATATMSNVTALSRTLEAGAKYTFRASLFVSNSTAAEGIKIDFDGGTATATDFRAHVRIFDTALLTSAQTTALATDVTAATLTGAGLVEISGSLTVNAAGTFIIRAAENSTATGTLTIETGSNLWIEDTLFF